MNQKWTALLLTTAMLATGASAALAYETLQPGSNGQEVLDARMRLYELGYFKKQPTQTEYTENMKKYVRQFEKDYGLTEDGILSPADQEVLFGGTQGASETVSQTSTFEPIVISDQLQIDGIFVNDAYQDKKNPSMTEIVLCYTLSSTGKNYDFVGNKTNLTFVSGNSYDASHNGGNECLYFGSYYHGSTYLKTVYYGDQFHVVDIIRVPKGELQAGRQIALSNPYVEDMAKAELTTDQLIHCKDMESIAKLVDPDGYAKQVYALKEADSSTKNKIRKYVNGYYWDFYVNNLSYRIEFSKNTYSLSCHGLETTGKYTICNGYVILTNDSTGAKNYLPYTLESNDIDLDITAGFDVFEN